MRALTIAQLKLIRAAPVLTNTAYCDDWKPKDCKRRTRYTRKRTFACAAISVASGQERPWHSAKSVSMSLRDGRPQLRRTFKLYVFHLSGGTVRR
jgi:hypothetical protein